MSSCPPTPAQRIEAARAVWRLADYYVRTGETIAGDPARPAAQRGYETASAALWRQVGTIAEREITALSALVDLSPAPGEDT